MDKLKFEKQEEALYSKYLFDNSINNIRKILILSAILFGTFGFIDYLLVTDHLYIFFIIRFYIVIPFIILSYGLSYTKYFILIYQYLLTTLYVVSGLGLVVMLVLEPYIFSYYGGLFLQFGFGFFLLGIKWEFATITSGIIVFTYLVLSFIYLEDIINDALIYSFFYIGFIVIAMIGSYSQSLHRRNSYLHQLSHNDEKSSLKKQISKSNNITVYALAKLAESKDHFTGDHIDRVGRLSLSLAKAIDSSVYTKNNINKNKFIKSIELASTLHDIGKIGIPEKILMKPGPLSTEEEMVMQEHCYIGTHMLIEIKEKYEKNIYINMGIDICCSHHENFDGTGYPKGLVGKEIPFSARLVAVIDVYDALISVRPYKKASTIAKALLEVVQLSGTKFDKDIVDAFAKMIYQTKNV